jgi:hypothetical protein
VISICFYLYFIIIYYNVHHRCTLYAFMNIIIIIIIIIIKRHMRILCDDPLLYTTALKINYTLNSTRPHRFSPRTTGFSFGDRTRLICSFRAFLLNNIIILCSNKDTWCRRILVSSFAVQLQPTTTGPYSLVVSTYPYI